MAFEAKVTGGEKCAACEGTGRDPRYAWIKSRDCPICKGHARYPMTVDIRGYKPPGSITNLPKGWDSTYDHILGDPPDNRSPMIQALDGKGWRESLVIADVLADETLWNDGRRPNVYGWTKGENPVRKREVDNLMRALPYLLDIPKVKCPVIRMLDDPAWRERLKVAETPQWGRWTCRFCGCSGDGPVTSTRCCNCRDVDRIPDEPKAETPRPTYFASSSLCACETPIEAEYAGVRERLEAMRPAPPSWFSSRTGYEP